MLPPENQKSADDFFAAIGPCEAAFQHVGFSYLAVRFGAPFTIIAGRIFMSTAPPPKAAPHFQSPRVRAGRYALADLGFDVRGLMRQLLTGSLKTPHGELLFTPGPGGHHGASFQPFHPDGLQRQQRFNVLTLIAGETENLRQTEIDWEIKAASPPYDGLQELANEFGLVCLCNVHPMLRLSR